MYLAPGAPLVRNGPTSLREALYLPLLLTWEALPLLMLSWGV